MRKKISPIIISFVLAAISSFSPQSMAAESGVTDFTVRIKNISTCTFSTRPVVELGDITVDTKANFDNKKLLVNVLCPDTVSSYIWANVKPLTGYFATADTMWIDIDGSILSGSYGTKFSLFDENKNKIILNGGGENDAKFGFCGGTTTRTCALTPYLEAGSETGNGSITMVFNIRHS